MKNFFSFLPRRDILLFAGIVLLFLLPVLLYTVRDSPYTLEPETALQTTLKPDMYIPEQQFSSLDPEKNIFILLDSVSLKESLFHEVKFEIGLEFFLEKGKNHSEYSGKNIVLVARDPELSVSCWSLIKQMGNTPVFILRNSHDSISLESIEKLRYSFRPDTSVLDEMEEAMPSSE